MTGTWTRTPRRPAKQQVGGCSGDDCPDARGDDDTVAIRGDGEAVMRLPRAMVLDTAGRLAQG
jgi:hypothetical protein